MASRRDTLTADEWNELIALKSAITDNIAAVHPSRLERFSELFARTLQGKGDQPVRAA